jgi:hypothetical protein
MLGADSSPIPFDAAALKTLEAALSSPDGMDIREFLATFDEHFERPRAKADVQAYREGRKPWKKLADEVAPVAAYLRQAKITGRIRFPLNDQPPDAWLLDTGANAENGIEVTRVLARPKVELAQRLRDEPVAPGFLGLADDAPAEVYQLAKKRNRITNSRKGIEGAIEASITERLARKSDPKFKGQTLVLVTPLGSAPENDWEPLKARLHTQAAETAFDRIFLVEDGRFRQPVLLFERTAHDQGSGPAEA